jgi:hypothetical protein
LKLPYQSKPAKRTAERNVYFLDPSSPEGAPHGLCFKSINEITWDENQFIDGQKQAIGRNCKDVSDAIIITAETVAEATGRDINDIAFALTEYRDDAGSGEQPTAYLQQSGMISLHAPTEFKIFVTALRKALESETLTRLMVVIQRAAATPELEFDPDKYALGDGENLHEEYKIHLVNFFVIESMGQTDYHLTPIEGKENAWLFKYDVNNYAKPEPTVKEKEEQTVAKKERIKAAVGKS